MGWVICLMRAFRSVALLSWESEVSLMGQDYVEGGGQYTPALNCRVLNWPAHGGFSSVVASFSRVASGEQTASNVMNPRTLLPVAPVTGTGPPPPKASAMKTGID